MHADNIVISPKVKFSNYEQLKYLEMPNQSLEGYLMEKTDYPVDFVRSVLARLGFSYREFRNNLQNLSGGERVRVLLAKTFLQPGNVIILDEATNFMDFNTIQALKSLVINYPGMVLFTSHDANFISETADQVFIIQDNMLKNQYKS